VSRRDTATSLIVSRVIRDRLQAADKAFRERAREDFDVPGVRDIGVIGDEQIGSVSLTKGRESWTVTDPEALLEWVKANFPQEVVTTEAVRSSYVQALLARAKADGVAVDAFTGEQIPGIEQKVSEPTLTVKPSEDAAQVIAQALADGTLTLADVVTPLPIEAKA
jgi:hypothetical protein